MNEGLLFLEWSQPWATKRSQIKRTIQLGESRLLRRQRLKVMGLGFASGA